MRWLSRTCGLRVRFGNDQPYKLPCEFLALYLAQFINPTARRVFLSSYLHPKPHQPLSFLTTKPGTMLPSLPSLVLLFTALTATTALPSPQTTPTSPSHKLQLTALKTNGPGCPQNSTALSVTISPDATTITLTYDPSWPSTSAPPPSPPTAPNPASPSSPSATPPPSASPFPAPHTTAPRHSTPG